MTPSEFKTFLPAFGGVDDPVIQFWIDRAAPYFNVARWGDKYSDGLGYWVASKLVRHAVPGAPTAGTLTSLVSRKKVGAIEVQYSDKMLESAADDPFKADQYGREYLALRDDVGLGAVAV